MTSDLLFDLQISAPVICIACSEDGSKVAVGDRNGTLTLVDKNGSLLWEKNIDEGIHGLAIVGNGNKVICGGKDCKLRMFNSMGSIEWEQTVGKSIWSLDADSNGQYLAVGTGDSIAVYNENGLLLWEYQTNRAMVGTGISRNGSLIIGCGDEYLYCLDSEGNLRWEKQRSDSLWDVSVDKAGETIFVGGWDQKVHCLDSNGDDLWSFETGGYVRAVKPIDEGGIIVGSHDYNIYRLSASGELLESITTEGEITCICSSRQNDIMIAGLFHAKKICAYGSNSNSKPLVAPVSNEIIDNNLTSNEEEYEPMFGAGMFDEPMPDTTGILSRDEPKSKILSKSRTFNDNLNTSPQSYSYEIKEPSASTGGEYREFASEVVKGDVKNYLRLGNSAWLEKRLERAAEHFKRATEIDPEEPRAWHNLAVCNYHLALKRNPENIKGAVQSAFVALETAKEKGGTDYRAPDKTLKYFAQQLGAETE